jgi:hypothetical protein
MTTTVDLRRELRALYTATSTPAVVEVPELPFLMIDGHGDPNTAPAYPQAVEALYTVAYTVRFALKRGPAAIDAPVMPLEGLWWTPDMATFSVEDKSAWDWTMMILLPPQATAEVVDEARAAAARKKQLAGDRPGPAGAPRGGPLRADPARRAVPHRRADRREAARVHRRARRRAVGQAPRDLPRRSTTIGAGAAAHHRAPADDRRERRNGRGGPARNRTGTDEVNGLSENRRSAVGAVS